MNTFELLQKYDVPGPRYTSYPTAPIWSETVGVKDYISSLQAVKAGKPRTKAEGFIRGKPLSLYFHMPFCENKCHFCGCTRISTNDHSLSAVYTEILLKEIHRVAKELQRKNEDTKKQGYEARGTVNQVHFGGGSPNFFRPEEISQIMSEVRGLFDIQSDAEIAIEMNPKTSSKEFCANLWKEGFNRISVGVQDFNDNVQKLINRFQTFQITSEMISYLRELGFRHFNFDLVYGLPGQTPETFEKTLEQTLQLKPNRLAVYSYAHMPWSHPEQRSFKESDIPLPETKIKLFEMALNYFSTHGYHLIGMDHFAEEGDELFAAVKNRSVHRNFMGYSTRADAHQIGFGATSISYVNGNYFQNTRDVCQYQGIIEEHELATFRGFILSDDDKVRRAFITEMMCHLFVDFDKFSKDHKIDVEKYFADEFKLLKDFIDDGLIELTKNHLKVTPQGHLVVRNIAMCFDKYLGEIKKTARNPVFSRTV